MFDVLTVSRYGAVKLPTSFLNHYRLGIRDKVYFEQEVYGFRITSSKTLKTFKVCLLNRDGSVELPPYVLDKVGRPRLEAVSLPQDGKGGLILLFKDHNYIQHAATEYQNAQQADPFPIRSCFYEDVIRRHIKNIEVGSVLFYERFDQWETPGVYSVYDYSYSLGKLSLQTRDMYGPKELTMVFTNEQLEKLELRYGEYYLHIDSCRIRFY